ncbi:tetratricopeptide repeat protein [Streptomyces sp. NPDC050421]|uniref:tetratricopeptide repeat protein n=1 Tax=Streptomyces sp. NPDC050421 TaxID=3365613 RepID=UPI00379EE284
MDVLDPEVLRCHEAFPSDFSVDRLELIIEALQTLSLLEITEVIAERHETQPAITVHSLVLEVNRGHLATADAVTRSRLTRTAVGLLEVATRRVPEDRANHLWWGLLHPHIMTLIRSTETPHKDISEPLLEVGLRNFSYMHLAIREPMKEAANALRALSMNLDSCHPLRLAARHRYTLTHIKEKGQLWAFSELYKECVLALGGNHAETLMSHHNWAERLLSSGRFKQAEAECRRALRGRQQILGDDDPFTLSTHLLLIRCIEDQKGGKVRSQSEWELLYESVITSPNPGKAHLETLHMLGHWLDSHKRYTEAEKCYRTIIEALEENPAEGIFFRDSMRDCLANNLEKQGRLDDSASMYLERLRQLQETQDAADWEVMAVRHDYADLLVKMGRLSEAESIMRSVLEIRLSKEDKVQDLRLASELHCFVHALERMDRTQEVVSMGRHLAHFSDAEMTAWSEERKIRDDIVCICKSLSDAGDHEVAIESLSRIIDCVPPETKEAHSHRRTLALFRYTSGEIDKASFEDVLHGLAKSIQEKFGEDEEFARIQDVLMGLRGGPGKSNLPS